MDVLPDELFGVDSTRFARDGFLQLYDKAPDLKEAAKVLDPSLVTPRTQ